MRIKVPKPTAHVPRDGRAGGAHRRRAASRTPALGPAARQRAALATRSAAAGRRLLGARACGRPISPPSSALEGDSQLPPPAARRRRTGDLHRPARDRRDARRLWRPSQRAVRHPDPRTPPARRDRRALPDPRRKDARPASARFRSAPTWSTSWSPTWTRLRRAGRSTEPDAYLFPNLRGGRMSRQRVARDRRRGRSELASERLTARGLPAAPEHHAAHAAANLHLDCAAGQPVRRPVGDEPGRPRRLEDDDGRLRAAAAACRARARAGVRRARPASPRPPVRRSARRLRWPAPTAVWALDWDT